jgi:hypothetical protein
VFDDDFVATSRERLAPDTAPLGPDEYVRIVDELRAGVTRDAESYATYDVLAVRGDNHCLVRPAMTLEGNDVSKLFVVETDDELIRQYVFFDPDALHDALDLLNELWSPDGMDPRHLQVESRYRRTFASGTADDFRALATDDFVFRDHRKLGMGVRGLDEYLATSGDFFGCGEMIISEVLDWSGPVLLLRATFRLLGDDQIADPQLRTVAVSRGDRLAAQEPFDPDDLDNARARFDELVAEHAGPPAAEPGGEVPDEPLRNLAVDLAMLTRRAIIDDEYDQLRRWQTDGFAVRIERRANPYRSLDGDMYVAGIRSTARLGLLPTEWEAIEIRGEQLALVRCDMIVPDTGDVLGIVALVHVDAQGRGLHTIEYEPEDIDIARRELDRRWAAMND